MVMEPRGMLAEWRQDNMELCGMVRESRGMLMEWRQDVAERRQLNKERRHLIVERRQLNSEFFKHISSVFCEQLTNNWVWGGR